MFAAIARDRCVPLRNKSAIGRLEASPSRYGWPSRYQGGVAGMRFASSLGMHQPAQGSNQQ